jgi:hypothetical protein
VCFYIVLIFSKICSFLGLSFSNFNMSMNARNMGFSRISEDVIILLLVKYIMFFDTLK